MFLRANVRTCPNKKENLPKLQNDELNKLYEMLDETSWLPSKQVARRKDHAREDANNGLIWQKDKFVLMSDTAMPFVILLLNYMELGVNVNIAKVVKESEVRVPDWQYHKTINYKEYLQS